MVATYKGSMEIVGLFKLNELTTSEVVANIKRAMDMYEGTIFEKICGVAPLPLQPKNFARAKPY